MLLHPLRSELNWPHGERAPIHFAPMRWQLPFFLLDGPRHFRDRAEIAPRSRRDRRLGLSHRRRACCAGMLYSACGQCTATWHESPEALSLLQKISQAVQAGLTECTMQALPQTGIRSEIP